MEIVMLAVDVVRKLLQRAGPYIALEILLPGGTLLALLLFLLRHGSFGSAHPLRPIALAHIAEPVRNSGAHRLHGASYTAAP